MPDAATTVQTLLRALAAEDWQAVWRLHHPDALMIVGPQVLPQRLIPADSYANVMASIAEAQRPAGLPEFRWLGGDVSDDGQDALVLARLQEDQRTFEAAFRICDGTVLSMVTAPGSLAAADVQAAADLVQLPLPTERHEGFLTTLHHSYARRYQGLKREIRVLPEARFTCQGRGDCCKVGNWTISVGDNQRQPLERLAVAAGTTSFRLAATAGEPRYADPEATSDRYPIAVGQWPGCHQLDDAGRCQLHASVGWQPIPVCQLYPVNPVPTPDGFDVTVHYTCQTVCLNQGERLADQTSDLAARLWPYQFRLEGIGERLSLRSGDQPNVSWELYKEWEAELLDVLSTFQAEGKAALEEGSHRLAAWLGREKPATVMDADRLFAGLLKPDAPQDWGQGWLGGGYARAWELVKAQPVAFQGDREVLQRYMRTIYFRKYGLAGGAAGISFPWGLVLAAYRMVVADSCFRAGREGRTVTTSEDVMTAVRAVEAMLGHEPLAGWLARLPGSPLESPATWRALLAGV